MKLNHTREEAHSIAAVDAVLASLAAAEPPAGMSGRLTLHLQSQARRETRWHANAKHVLGTLAASATCCAALWLGVHALRLKPAPVPWARAQGQPASQPETITARVPHISPLRCGSALCPATTIRFKPKQATGDLTLVSTAPSIPGNKPYHAIADRGAAGLPSVPEPALPLTAQERELIRVVQARDPAQLALLNRTEQARRDTNEQQEVVAFFHPLPIPQVLSRLAKP